MKLAYLVAGGALGTLSRYWLSGAVNASLGANFPYGTLSVNALGCFVIGLLSALEPLHLSAEARLFFTAGFCGAFTTFSAFILDTEQLAANGQALRAVLNVLLSLAAGFASFFAGVRLGERF